MVWYQRSVPLKKYVIILSKVNSFFLRFWFSAGETKKRMNDRRMNIISFCMTRFYLCGCQNRLQWAAFTHIFTFLSLKFSMLSPPIFCSIKRKIHEAQEFPSYKMRFRIKNILCLKPPFRSLIWHPRFGIGIMYQMKNGQKLKMFLLKFWSVAIYLSHFWSESSQN